MQRLNRGEENKQTEQTFYYNYVLVPNVYVNLFPYVLTLT